MTESEIRFPLPLPPGLRNTGTAYQAAGRWTDGNRVRFHNGTIQPIGGWAARTITGEENAGAVRGAVQWTPEVLGVAQAPVLAYGTTSNLFVVVEGVRYDITPIGLGTNTSRVWSFAVFGSYLIAVADDPADYTKRKGPFVWTGDVEVVAQPLAAAPATPSAVVVTAERFLFQLSGVDPLGPNYLNFPTVPSVRTVLWPSQETLTDWTPTAENSAGSFPLATEGALRGGVRVRGRTLLLTTTDAHTATYIGGEFVYRFEQAGIGCGLIATNAVLGLDTAAYWMGPKGFYVYDGFVKRIPCEVEDYVFGSLNRAVAFLIWAYANPAYSEVTWHYPSAAATACDRYVTYNYAENTWTYGTLARSAGVSAQPPGIVPVLLGDDGVVYDHETGVLTEAPLPYLESGPVQLDTADQVMQVQKLYPDEKTLGQVNATFYGRFQPLGSETTYGPFTLAAETDVRFTARLVRVRFTQVASAAWRLGTLLLGIVPSGRR